jgi:hypothetical protein
MVNMKPSPRPELSVLHPSKGVVELKVKGWSVLGGNAGRTRKQQATDFVILSLFILSWFQVSLSTLWERQILRIKQLRALRNKAFSLFWICIVFLYFYDKCTQVLHGNAFFRSTYREGLVTY